MGVPWIQTLTYAIGECRSILGPALGGALAEPCVSYPGIFARGTIFDRYPYLLPNLVCALVVIGGVIVGLLFLEETHEEKKYRRDMGLEAGRWITRTLWTNRATDRAHECKAGDAYCEESRSLMREDDPPPGYRTTEGSPRPPTRRGRAPSPASASASATATTSAPRLQVDHVVGSIRSHVLPSVGKAFTRQVVLLIIGYGLLA